MKNLILILAILMLPKAFAIELEDVTTLRDSAYRVGTSDEVEIKYKLKDRVNDNIVKKEEEIIDSRALTTEFNFSLIELIVLLSFSTSSFV